MDNRKNIATWRRDKIVQHIMLHVACLALRDVQLRLVQPHAFGLSAHVQVYFGCSAFFICLRKLHVRVRVPVRQIKCHCQ